ncbi:ABC transporter permease subunit [Corynebacterium ulceribovis]|uniref:ABC transporter permease subunit n=1 Tax=Corynebacterium ulceribovis TaxID=487732 RepID=UPI00037FCB8D|nr:ABC transporter permease subunit [Corynebacterium ulceribovis]
MKRVATWLLVFIWASAITAAVLGPAISGWLGLPDPATPVARPFDEPTAAHIFGTDRLGRDLLAQLLSGNAALLIPPAIAALAATSLGFLLGLLSAAVPWLRPVLHSGLEIVLVIPGMILLLATITATQANFTAIAVVAVVMALPQSAKFLGAAAESVLASGFVARARVTGDSWPTIVVREVLPAMRRPLVADVGVRFVAIVFITATVSFLGASSGNGGQTWAALAAAGLAGIDLNVWAVAAPVLAIGALTAPPALLLDLWTGEHR